MYEMMFDVFPTVLVSTHLSVHAHILGSILAVTPAALPFNMSSECQGENLMDKKKKNAVER